MHKCSSWASFGAMKSSNPNMSRIPMKPSVAWRTALFRATIDFEPEFPPMVEACWLFTSAWLCTDSFESELRVPEPRLRRNLISFLMRLDLIVSPFKTVCSSYNRRNRSAVESFR